MRRVARKRQKENLEPVKNTENLKMRRDVIQDLLAYGEVTSNLNEVYWNNE